MVDLASSVLAKIKNRAIESGRSYQLCLQLFCQEEFLRRLEASKYTENFILKGGLFIYSISNFDSRVTVDVDFLLKNIPNTQTAIEEMINEIFEVNSGNDFVSFKITKTTAIAVEKKYSGISVSIVAFIKNVRVPFSIDFGFGDIIVPKQEKRNIPTQLNDFKSPSIYTYSIETTIAEKIDAILDLMEFSSRMKDYFDIYYLANRYEFDIYILSNAMKATFANRNHNFDINRFDRILTFVTDDSMNQKWNAFKNKMNIKTKEFPFVITAIHQFLREPFLMACTKDK